MEGWIGLNGGCRGHCVTLPIKLSPAVLHCAFPPNPLLPSNVSMVDPCVRVSNEHLPTPYASLWQSAEGALCCAHRTSAVSSCAFREQEDDQACQSLLAGASKNVDADVFCSQLFLWR